MIKCHFIIDKTNNNIKVKKIFLKKYKNYNLKSCNVFVVLGGDGFMLKVLKKYQNYYKPFYGINTGTYGFLMNKFKTSGLNKSIADSKVVTISPLEMNAITRKEKRVSAIAINEISLLRQSRQTASLRILNKKNIIIKKLISDGVLISTPAGSTAYNSSVNGPILFLNSKKLAITPISPFRPRGWRGKVVSFNSIINVKNLNIKKRSLSVVADNIEVRNVKSVKIKINNKIKIKLLHDKNNSLSKKIKLEQKKRRKLN